MCASGGRDRGSRPQALLIAGPPPPALVFGAPAATRKTLQRGSHSEAAYTSSAMCSVIRAFPTRGSES